MAKIWLTYAWKDNADQDIDHVVAELQKAGLDVGYDRAELLAGQRLWQQIDKAMNDETVDAWAMFVTENSLKSEPCQEEIAIALDRALRSGRANFPLIGIFPLPVDRSIIPSAIATRLYVDLTAADWQQQVVDGTIKAKSAASITPPTPFGHQWHQFNGGEVLEVWPRSGRWYPFVAAVEKTEGDKLQAIMCGPRGCITGTGMTQSSGRQENAVMSYEVIQHAIDASNSAHIFFSSRPRRVEFGDPRSTIFSING